jgi:hypothetical protein
MDLTSKYHKRSKPLKKKGEARGETMIILSDHLKDDTKLI